MAQRRPGITDEIPLTSWSGYLMLLIALALVGLPLYSFIAFPPSTSGMDIPLRMLAIAAGIFIGRGVYIQKIVTGAVTMIWH